MQFLQFQLAEAISGAIVPFGKCFVYLTGTSTLAALYDGSGNPISNPAVASALGQVGFAAANGTYDFQPAYADGTSAGPKILKQQLFDLTGLPVAIGLFTAASALSIPTGTDLVQTSGYATSGKGHALYVYDAAVDSAWVTAHPGAGFVSSNGRGFRLSTGQIIEPYHFGAVGDWNGSTGTVDATAFANAFAYLDYLFISAGGAGYYGAVPSLHIPATGKFNLGATVFERFKATRIYGANTGLPDDYRSMLRFAVGGGFITQRYNTSGVTGTDAGTHTGADGSEFEGLCLWGGYSLPSAETDNNAIQMRSRATVRRCNFLHWGGHAVYISADSGSSLSQGNANGWVVDTITAVDCRTPLYVRGADSNAGSSNRVTALACRMAGIVDDSFLGNSHKDFWSEACGAVAGTPYAVWCSYSGNVYVVIWGQEAGASTNAPSGTTADNTWWKYAYAGAANNGLNRPAWVTGLSWKSGGAFVSTCINNPCVFEKPYMEGGAPPAQGAQSVMIIAPQDGTSIVGIPGLGIPCVIEPHFGQLKIRSNIEVVGTVITDSTTNGQQMLIGPTSNTGQDHTATFNSGATKVAWDFWSYGSGASQNGAQWVSAAAWQTFFKTAWKITHLTLGDSLVADSTGLNIVLGATLKISGTQVLGARKTGWGADTGTAKRTANASYGAGAGLTFSATYTQSELTALATRLAAVESALQNATQAQKAIKDDLISHGAIGA